LKTLPVDARLLDIGAGSGGMIGWREYLEPDRRDLRMFAADLAAGEHFPRYEDYQVGNIEEQGIRFPDDSFDGIIGSHIIEHLKSPREFLGALFAKLRPGGRAYLEMPAPLSKTLPTVGDMAERGMPVMISNFYDDGSHIDTFPLETLGAWAQAAGFAVDASGIVRHPFIEDRLLQFAVDNADSEMGLYGYWSITGWAQYVILRRPWPDGNLPDRIRRLVDLAWEPAH
jgi:SAM-dependent methyltransferase